jgi:hypothetical protein
MYLTPNSNPHVLNWTCRLQSVFFIIFGLLWSEEYFKNDLSQHVTSPCGLSGTWFMVNFSSTNNKIFFQFDAISDSKTRINEGLEVWIQKSFYNCYFVIDEGRFAVIVLIDSRSVTGFMSVQNISLILKSKFTWVWRNKYN